MKVVICGAGRVGTVIARELAGEGEEVVVVDQHAELIHKITTRLDVRGIIGHGAYPDVLERANLASADMMIAVTSSDEVNMVACQVAHSLFSVPTKIARLRAQNYLDPAWSDLFSRKSMPIDVIISPEIEVGHSVLRCIKNPASFDTILFADGLVNMVGIQLQEGVPLLETPIKQLKELFLDLKQVDITAIKRDEDWFIPKKEDHLAEGDEVYFTAEANKISRLLELLGQSQEHARRVIIIGGGNVGVYVAKALEQIKGVRVRLIEADKNRAERAAEQLHKTVVLHGDGLDSSLLHEAGIQDAEAIVCLTNEDKVNILSAVVAKREGNPRSICLVNDRSFFPFREELGIDIFVDPRSSTVSTILRHVRKGRIIALQSIDGGQAEVIEAIALNTSPLVGKPLKEAEIPDGVAIGSIIRKNEVLDLNEESIIKADDRVVLFVTKEAIRKVEQMFRVSLEFF